MARKPTRAQADVLAVLQKMADGWEYHNTSQGCFLKKGRAKEEIPSTVAAGFKTWWFRYDGEKRGASVYVISDLGRSAAEEAAS